MPPNSANDILSRALRTSALRVGDDGSVKLTTDADSRLTRQFDRIGLSKRVRDLIENPAVDWSTTKDIEEQRDKNAQRQIDQMGPVELDMLDTVRQKIAMQAIEQEWTALGGPSSAVGLPLTNQIMLRQGTDGGYDSAFRSGYLRWKPGEPVQINVDTWVQVRFVGLECGIRQEGNDEVYGVVTCQVPSMGIVKSHIFPGGNETIDMGEPGQRLWPTDVELYKGPIADIKLWCSLIENDSGDVEDISQNLANQIAEKLASPLGGVTGLSAEAIADETWYMEGIGLAVGWLLDGVFGMGDDPYTPVPKAIPWDELAQFVPPFPVTRSDDAKVIERATHKILMEGVDDGGDRGLYAAYFYVRPVPWDPT